MPKTLKLIDELCTTDSKKLKNKKNANSIITHSHVIKKITKTVDLELHFGQCNPLKFL